MDVNGLALRSAVPIHPYYDAIDCKIRRPVRGHVVQSVVKIPFRLSSLPWGTIAPVWIRCFEEQKTESQPNVIHCLTTAVANRSSSNILSPKMINWFYFQTTFFKFMFLARKDCHKRSKQSQLNDREVFDFEHVSVSDVSINLGR